MISYLKMERVFNVLAPTDENNQVYAVWKVKYLDRFNVNENQNVQEKIVKNNKLAYSTDPTLENIYKYKLSKKRLDSI